MTLLPLPPPGSSIEVNPKVDLHDAFWSSANVHVEALMASKRRGERIETVANFKVEPSHCSPLPSIIFSTDTLLKEQLSSTVLRDNCSLQLCNVTPLVPAPYVSNAPKTGHHERNVDWTCGSPRVYGKLHGDGEEDTWNEALKGGLRTDESILSK